MDADGHLEINIAKSKVLKGFVPICSSCKDIRNKQGIWISFEEFFDKKMGMQFSHGICPKCVQKLYPEFYNKVKK